MHLIHTLRTRQRCGAVSVTYDVTRKMTVITCVFKFVAYINPRKNTIDIFGLGDCSWFELNHKRYMRYIENSRIRVSNGVIFENKLRRSRFTPPSTMLRLRSVFDVRLRRVELDGVSTLKELSQRCIDSQELFELFLNSGTRLQAGLPISRIRCVLEPGSSIATSTELPTGRLLWQLTDLELVLHGAARVSGVYVTHKLVTTHTTGDASTLDISTDEECTTIEHVPHIVETNTDIQLMGREHSPPRRAIVNEHGMIEMIEDNRVPQEVLDASRAAYDEQQRPLSSTPLFAVCGDTKLSDETARDGDSKCLVCMSNKAVVIMSNCGHVVSCVQCAHEMCSYTNKCPMCRAEIGTAVIPFGLVASSAAQDG